MAKETWALVAKQHGVIARRQLKEIGYTRSEIEHRLDTRRLFKLFWGVYAVGRPEVTHDGRWMAAALTCGDEAFISDSTAGAFWEIRADRGKFIHVSTPKNRKSRGLIIAHQRAEITPTICRNIPVEKPIDVLVDLAVDLKDGPLESAINAADKLDLVDPETLRMAIAEMDRPGSGKLRAVLDRATFVYTDSELERAFVPLAIKAGYGKPLTQKNLGAGRTDFYFDGIVVECDGLRYHRTPFSQTSDLKRDQAHKRKGLGTLRFSHAQIKYERAYVVETLRDVRAA